MEGDRALGELSRPGGDWLPAPEAATGAPLDPTFRPVTQSQAPPMYQYRVLPLPPASSGFCSPRGLPALTQC